MMYRMSSSTALPLINEIKTRLVLWIDPKLAINLLVPELFF